VVCPGATSSTFTQWDMAGKNGTPTTIHWLDFSDPAARQRMLDMETDMLTKYPTCDGIHWIIFGIQMLLFRLCESEWALCASRHHGSS